MWFKSPRMASRAIEGDDMFLDLRWGTGVETLGFLISSSLALEHYFGSSEAPHNLGRSPIGRHTLGVNMRHD